MNADMIPTRKTKNERWRALVAFAPAAWALAVFACEATSEPACTFIKHPPLSTTGRNGASGFAERAVNSRSVFGRRTLRQTEGRRNKRRAWCRCDESRVKMASGSLGESSSSRGLVFPTDMEAGWFDSATVGSPRVHRCES